MSLWQEHLPAILEELGPSLPDFGTDKDAGAWQWLQQYSMFFRKGQTCNLTRFHSVVKDGSALLPRWSTYLFQLEYISLELDFLKGRKLMDRICAKTSGADQSAPVTTANTSVTTDERTLRSCAQNSVVVSLLVLSDPNNRRILALVTHLCRPVTKWYSAMEVAIRSVDIASSWVVAQVSGGYYEHIRHVLLGLSRDDFFQAGGFVLPSLVAVSEDRAREDDEFAALAGDLVFSLMGARMRRSLWLIASYPGLFFQLLADDENIVASALSRVKEYEIFWQAATAAKLTGSRRSDASTISVRVGGGAPGRHGA